MIRLLTILGYVILVLMGVGLVLIAAIVGITLVAGKALRYDDEPRNGVDR